jgi:hypothetical protein
MWLPCQEEKIKLLVMIPSPFLAGRFGEKEMKVFRRHGGELV